MPVRVVAGQPRNCAITVDRETPFIDRSAAAVAVQRAAMEHGALREECCD
jgi:hypothetical protein